MTLLKKLFARDPAPDNRDLVEVFYNLVSRYIKKKSSRNLRDIQDFLDNTSLLEKEFIIDNWKYDYELITAGFISFSYNIRQGVDVSRTYTSYKAIKNCLNKRGAFYHSMTKEQSDFCINQAQWYIDRFDQR